MLSLCMIVKNEEQQLAGCLDSVRPLLPELIIVDTGSTDGTADVARQYGAELIPFQFERVDFSAARNFALSRASGRWVLVLDADERLHPDSLPLLRKIAESREKAGYFLERVNRASDSPTAHTDYVVRLFRNHPKHRYQGRVHETVDDSIVAAGGKLVKSGIQIQHNFASNREARRRKNFWYIDILKEEIEANPGDVSRLDFLAAEYHQLEMFDEATAIAEKRATMKPLDPQAHLFAGMYHFLFKPDWPRARTDFQMALQLRPGYPEAESFLRLMDQQEAGLSVSIPSN